MRITAKFYSCDEAELAARSLRRECDGISDIILRQKRSFEETAHSAPLGFYINLSAGGYSFVPASVNGLTPENSAPPVYGAKENYSPSSYDSGECTLEIICREESRKGISAILIGRGGHALCEE